MAILPVRVQRLWAVWRSDRQAVERQLLLRIQQRIDLNIRPLILQALALCRGMYL
jgi:hypothetical protein